MNLKDLIQKQQKKPPRILIYSIPGWGKSTLASSMPKPIFIDVEDGLMGIKTTAFEIPASFNDIVSYIGLLLKEKHDYKTIVIDTLTNLEQLIFQQVCTDYNQKSIEDFGYGKGYIHSLEYWEKFLKGMEKLRNNGMAVLLLAHSEIKAIYDPISDVYDKYIIKLHKQPLPLVISKVDYIFFGTYKTTVSEEGEGFKKVKKGIGSGERIIYTEERPAFTAKSRLDLPFEIKVPKKNGWTEINKHMKNVIKEI
jgi:hypothetical protein